MKKLLIFILLLSPVLGLAGSKNTLFYEVSGNHLKKPSYLFGTIHAICEDDLELGKKLLKRLKKSDRLVLEIDIANPVNLIKLFSVNNMPGDTTLDMLLSKEEFAYVNAYLTDSLGIHTDKYMTVQPMIFTQQLMPQMLGCENITAVDLELMKLALKHKIYVEGLETIEDQMDVLSAITLHQQATMLYQQLKTFDESSKELQQLVNAYIERDLKKLNELVDGVDMLSDEANDKLLVQRNKKWIPKMIEFMSQGPSFFAFGAGHLAGDDGIIQLLKDKGYKVKPIAE